MTIPSTSWFKHKTPNFVSHDHCCILSITFYTNITYDYYRFNRSCLYTTTGQSRTICDSGCLLNTMVTTPTGFVERHIYLWATSVIICVHTFEYKNSIECPLPRSIFGNIYNFLKKYIDIIRYKLFRQFHFIDSTRQQLSGQLRLIASTQNQASGQFQLIASLRNSLYSQFHLIRQSPKSIVRTIAFDSQPPKSFVRTIPSNTVAEINCLDNTN